MNLLLVTGLVHELVLLDFIGEGSDLLKPSLGVGGAIAKNVVATKSAGEEAVGGCQDEGVQGSTDDL